MTIKICKTFMSIDKIKSKIMQIENHSKNNKKNKFLAKYKRKC